MLTQGFQNSFYPKDYWQRVIPQERLKQLVFQKLILA